MSPEQAQGLEPGHAVVYRPRHPDAQPEDGTVVRVSADGATVMVAYRNGPQAGKTCSTSAADLTHLLPGRGRW